MENNTVKNFLKELNIKDDFLSNLELYIKSGNNKLQQFNIVESMTIDDSWINIIQSLMNSLEQIVKNPKKFIKDEEVLVNVEKAKKITSKTIRHLASHTNFIRAIDEKGKIQPSKVMTKEMQEDIYIYENRFVYSLILKLQSFIEQRYTAIKEQIDTYDTTNLKMLSKFKLDKGEVEYDMDIKIRKEPKSKVNVKKNFELLDKLSIIRKRIKVIKNSPFGKLLSHAKTVNSPIMKTNIINMHKDYNDCYKLWMFLSSYTAIGYSVQIDEKKLPIDTEYYDDLTMLIAIGLKTMQENNALREPLYKKAPSKKRRIKKFKEIKKIEYTPSLRSTTSLKTDEMVNQYYYDKLKELVMEKEELKASDLIDNDSLKVSFQKFYRGITKLTNEMYYELLSISKYKEPLRKQTKLQKAKQELKKQQEICKKLQILNRLKANELLQSLKKHNTQKLKLDRLKFQVETLKAKEDNKKPSKSVISVSKTDPLITDKLKTVMNKALEDEKVRKEKELNRQKKIIEKKKGTKK